MKRYVFSFLISFCIILNIFNINVIAAERVSDELINITQWESDHPPLSDEIKKAIAAYKRNPCEATEQALLKSINEAYDKIIETKVNNRYGYIKTRISRIKGWMDLIVCGQLPSFMLLNTDNNKAAQRQAVAEAVNIYWENTTSENKALVKEALGKYYDAFLSEQDEIVLLTEQAREERVSASFERYTSDLFKIHSNIKSTSQPEDTLAEIICAYISVGSEIVYCNPESRVREREINADIYDMRTHYLNNPTPQTEKEFKQSIEAAFQTAYNVRRECYSMAQQKGEEGAEVLFEKFLEDGYIDEQFKELTEQRNLYGRIDRMVTYGDNTIGDWQPRLQEKSRELSKLINNYKSNSTQENKKAVKEKFYEIYRDMLNIHYEHLNQVQGKFKGFIDETFHELLGETTLGK